MISVVVALLHVEPSPTRAWTWLLHLQADSSLLSHQEGPYVNFWLSTLTWILLCWILDVFVFLWTFLRFFSEVQLNYLQTVWFFQVLLLNFVRWGLGLSFSQDWSKLSYFKYTYSVIYEVFSLAGGNKHYSWSYLTFKDCCLCFRWFFPHPKGSFLRCMH